jgi:RNA polymerase sigma factor (sigma-70 family)
MIEANTAPSLAALLQHAAWARRLARGLVGNDGADDIVQDAWLAAVRRPPDLTRPPRPWLGTVVRNNAFNRSREHGRRESREVRAANGEASESPESALGRLELHRQLVEAVGRLPEPYRRVILLAYFDELTSAEIGARENVPASTIRGRVKTALDLLREALDEGFGGRGTWLPLIADLSRLPSGALAKAGHAGRASTVSGPAAGTGAGAVSGPLGLVAIAASALTLWHAAAKPTGSPRTTTAMPMAAADTESAPGESHVQDPSSGGSESTVRVATRRTQAAGIPTALVDHGAEPSGPVESRGVQGFVVAGGPEARRVGSRLGPGGGVAGALVRIEGPQPGGEPAFLNNTLLIRRLEFQSPFELVRPGTPVVVKNQDGVPHLVLVSRATTELIKEVIPALGVITLPSDGEIRRVEVLDTWGGSTFVVPSENDIDSVTRQDGRFVLHDLPPGRYVLNVWDEALGTQSTDFEVPLTVPSLRIVFGSEPLPEMGGKKGPCRIANPGHGPIGGACAAGGRDGATKVMKDLAKRARARGGRWTCDACHRDLDSYELTAVARSQFDQLLAGAGAEPRP